MLPVFEIPTAVAGIALTTQLFGILANVFFIAVMIRYQHGWNAGKILMVAYHTGALVHLLIRFFPLLAVAARGRDLTFAECVVPFPLVQAAGIYQPLCLAVMAYFRLKVIECATKNTDEPNVKRIVLILVAVVVGIIIVVNIAASASGAPIVWLGKAMLCVRLFQPWNIIFNLSFFCTAPYLIYAYRKIVLVIRDYAQDGGAEFVRLIYALVALYYVTYLPFFIGFLLDDVAGAVELPVRASQLTQWFHSTNSTFAPIVSILLTKRYRHIVACMLKGDTVISIKSSGKDGSSGGGDVSSKDPDVYSVRSTRVTSTCKSTSSKALPSGDDDATSPMPEKNLAPTIELEEASPASEREPSSTTIEDTSSQDAGVVSSLKEV